MIDETALLQVARFALDGRSTHPAVRLDKPVWPSFLGSVVHHRLTGLAIAAEEDGVLVLEADQIASLLERHHEAMICALTLERTLLEIGSAFEHEGIPLVVLKGPAVAHVGYPDPSWRPFGDIDVLVPDGSFGAACDVLSTLGYRRRFVDPRPGFAARFGKGAAHERADGLEIDLHRLLADGPFGYWIDHEEVLEATTSFELAGRKLTRLDDSGMLIHACMRASLGRSSPTLLQIRDVAQLARSDDVRWDVLADRGRRWRLQAVVGRALDLVGQRLAVTLPEEARHLRCSLRPSRREKRALRACASRGSKALASFLALPGINAKRAYAGALLFPDRRFLQARTGSGGLRGRIERWRAPLRWLSTQRR